MSESLRIRPASVDDAASIARVHVETWQSAYAGILPDEYLIGLDIADETRKWRTLLAGDRADTVALVAECTEETGRRTVVGFGTAGPAQDVNLLYDGEVYTLYVAPDWQGRDLGQRLLGALLRSLFERGMEDAIVWVLAGNASRFFYEHMGAQQIAQRHERVAGESVSSMAYGWSDLEAWLRQTGM